MKVKMPETETARKLKLKKKIIAEEELTFKVRGKVFNVKSKKPFLDRNKREILTEGEICTSPTPPPPRPSTFFSDQHPPIHINHPVK